VAFYDTCIAEVFISMLHLHCNTRYLLCYTPSAMQRMEANDFFCRQGFWWNEVREFLRHCKSLTLFDAIGYVQCCSAYVWWVSWMKQLPACIGRHALRRWCYRSRAAVLPLLDAPRRAFTHGVWWTAFTTCLPCWTRYTTKSREPQLSVV